MKPNNVDKALTSEPSADLWDDHAELTEKTEPTKLIQGRRPDSYFAAAHAAGEALRRLRHRDTPERPEQPPRPIGYCDACHHYVSGWHAGCSGVVRLVVDNFDHPEDLHEGECAKCYTAWQKRYHGRRKDAIPILGKANERELTAHEALKIIAETPISILQILAGDREMAKLTETVMERLRRHPSTARQKISPPHSKPVRSVRANS